MLPSVVCFISPDLNFDFNTVQNAEFIRRKLYQWRANRNRLDNLIVEAVEFEIETRFIKINSVFFVKQYYLDYLLWICGKKTN